MRFVNSAVCAIGLLGTPLSATPLLDVSPGNVVAVGSNNDFRANLLSLGITNYSNNRTISLSGWTRLSFQFLGSESGYTNRFTSGTVTWLETDSNHFLSPVAISGSYVLGAGNYVPYFSSPGVSATHFTPGSANFGIFLPSGTTRSAFSANSLIFGYDDPTSSRDKDYDDFLLRVTTAAPEPGTWAMMLLGFGLCGWVARRRPTVLVRAATAQ